MGETRDITTIIEELSLSGGSVSLGKCCKQTMKNWVNDINNALTKGCYIWRVVGTMENGEATISCIPKERYDSIKELL